MKKGVRAATFGNKSYRGRKAMETGIRAAAFGNKTYQEKIVERGRKAATFSNKGSGCSSCFFRTLKSVPRYLVSLQVINNWWPVWGLEASAGISLKVI